MTKPILVRPDGSIGPAGLKLIEKMASERKTQRTIAVALGISLKSFEKMMERKTDTSVRMAWETGFAQFEQEVQDQMYASAFGGPVELERWDPEAGAVVKDEDGKPEKVWVLAIPNSKMGATMAMFFSKAKLGWKDSGNDQAVTQDNRIQITLPDSMGFGEMLHGLGQKEIMDFRKDKTIPIKDITPRVALEGQARIASGEFDDKK
jgi:hypothetical protein